MSTEERIRDLLQRYADNQSSEVEIAEMLEGLHKEGGDAALESVLKDLFSKAEQDHTTIPADWETIWGNIKKNTAAPVRRMSWMRVAAAAVVVSMLFVAGYFYFDNKAGNPIAKTEPRPQLKNDAAPGGNRAVLTLANGSQITLSSALTGMITQQGNTKVLKLESGKIAYQSADADKQSAVQYNTITTPRGGQYQIILSDGSHVWLNAASSLRFPTAFTGNERTVEVTGEVYFEVAHNKALPFTVKKLHDDATVQVLGTHFNVNAYDDETDIRVTLLEGSVQVAKGNNKSMLKPGQQAKMNNAAITISSDLDMEEVMAWKNGEFQFGDASDIRTIMRQVSRWYDVDVEYQGTITGKIGGSISRDVNISQVLKMLATTGVINYQIQGNKVTIMPANY